MLVSVGEEADKKQGRSTKDKSKEGEKENQNGPQNFSTGSAVTLEYLKNGNNIQNELMNTATT
ncbi:2649_t:CDS:2 [Ambispora gerdemannii]|uniref:2649_t:CDS:1 n=1 Tax=Ambispora gerdemannii TaxID=144530 RepID=A0A9N9AE26_9GLOM|nr:2649_t:CDS:2 [Ambispora gerdemannii]